MSLTQHAVNTTAQHIEELASDEGLSIRTLIDGGLLEEAFTRHGIDFRDHSFPPDITLMAFCSQLLSPNRNCREAVARVNFDRMSRGLEKCSTSTSAYCQARQRLPREMIRDLALTTGRSLEKHAQNAQNITSRSVKIIDGSTLSMPDTKENQIRG